MVGLDTELGINAMAVGQVEQRTRADGDDELAGERFGSHGGEY
jgi:hypothetical protein